MTKAHGKVIMPGDRAESRNGEVGLMTDREIEFHYLKSNRHAEIKVDGALGGVSPMGESMFISVYTERAAIPKKIVQKWNEDGSLGEVLNEKTESIDGVVIRSVEATLHLTIDQARLLHKGIGEQISIFEKVRGEQNGDD